LSKEKVIKELAKALKEYKKKGIISITEPCPYCGAPVTFTFHFKEEK